MVSKESVTEFSIVEYKPEMAVEINLLWRLSFDLALGIKERSKRDSLNGQLEYLRNQLAVETNILVALDPGSSIISGFMALAKSEINQLYIHPDYQQMGLGRQFVNIAKERSDGALCLYTFQLNENAQCFYEAMGFEEVARGCADMESNPWADAKSQLKDIRYRWSRTL
ncbi:MAG: GNAT family N-acetyltransferase [Pseudomonadales bacterium]|nr:GNAT family N-acetyltransferase [Pseudomonadales bacterium]